MPSHRRFPDRYNVLMTRPERGNGISLIYEPALPVTDLHQFSVERYHQTPYFPRDYAFADTLAVDFVQRLRTLPVEKNYIVEVPYRPDLISWKNYGTTKLWWMILAYNGLMVSDLKTGIKVSLFRVGDLESLLYDMAQETRLIQAARENQ